MFGSWAKTAAFLIRMSHLAHGVSDEFPGEIPAKRAVSAAIHAIEQETKKHDAAELLWIGARESRLINGSEPQCGVMQVHVIGHCERNMQVGFELGVAKLEEWDGLCDKMRAHHHERCVHAGFAKGTSAARKQPKHWANSVQMHAERIRE